MVKPGVVLRRPVGTDRPFSEMPSCPSILAAEDGQKPPASRKPKGEEAFL
jgi:hypothetical protein